MKKQYLLDSERGLGSLLYFYMNHQCSSVVRWLFTSLFLFMTIALGVAQSGPGGVGNSSGTSGQPRNILWLDANSLSLSSGDNVATWTDRSGNGYDATASSGNEPVFTTSLVGGKPAIRFSSAKMDLNDELFNSTNGVIGGDYTILIVGARSGAGANYLIGGSSLTANKNLNIGWTGAGTSNNRFRFSQTYNSDQANSNPSSVSALNQFGIFGAQNYRNGFSGSTDMALWENGVIGTPVSNNTYLTATVTEPALARFNGTNYNVDIAEVIFYRTAINDAQRIIVENYLSQKYGISISSSDKYTNSAGYDIDLIGVGQTSGGSHTLASANGLYISTVSGLDNNEFVFAGHKGTENEPVVTDIPVGIAQRYSRDWYLDKTGNLSLKIVFDFPEAMQGAKNPQVTDNYRLLYRSGTTGNYSVVSGASLVVSEADQVAFNVLDADLNDGYYTLGTVNATESPVSGKDGITWYAYRSGNWNDATIWTLDPAAALYVNPSPAKYPNLATDNVVIPDGKNVIVTHNTIGCNNLTVYGRLDLAATSGHTFSTINGTGRILMAADNFPSGDATNFITKGQGQGQGTAVYYGSSFALTNNRTFYNMEVSMTSGNTLSMLSDITLNGNLDVESGTLRFSDNTSTTSRTLTVYGDVLVNSSSASIAVYNQDLSHTFNVYGNITNKGTIQLTNLTTPTYNSDPSSGYVVLNILGESNTTLEATGPTNLQRLVLNKGTDATYIFTVNPTNKAYFRLYGQNDNALANKALVILNGTLEFTGSTYIHSLTEGNADFEIPQTGGMWINGAAVVVQSTARDNNGDGLFTSVGVTTTNDGAQSFTVKGSFKISDGTFNTNSHGFVVWNDGNAYVKIDGGTVNTPGFRSGGSDAGKWTYEQTGGTVNMYGDYLSDLSAQGAPTFYIKGANNSFIMSGGTMVIYDAATPSNLAIGIESGIGNYSVTGGTIRIYSDANSSANYNISTTAPFFNFEVQAVNSANANTTLLNTPLVVLNNLSIGAYATLNANAAANTLSIGGDFTLADGGTFTVPSSHFTKFIGSRNSLISIGNSTVTSPLNFQNLTIEKNVHPTSGQRYAVSIAECVGRTTAPDVTSKTDMNTILTITGALTLERGNFAIDRYTVNLVGTGTLKDGSILTGNTNQGQLALTGTGSQTITASGAFSNTYGRLELFHTSTTAVRTIYVTNNISVDQLIMERATLVNIGANRLSIGAGGIINSGAFSNIKMIYTDGTSNAQGIQMHLTISGSYTTDQKIIEIPIGDGISAPKKYTPYIVLANNNFTQSTASSGTVRVNLIRNSHPAASGANILDCYWSMLSTGFDTFNKNNVKTKVLYSASVASNTAHTQLLYNNDWISDQGSVNTSSGDIVYNAPGLHFSADYTAGSNGSFTQPRVLYSITSGQFDDKNTWSTDGHNGSATNQAPRSFDVVEIGGTASRNDSVYITSTTTIAKIIINAPLTTSADAFGHSWPVLDIGTTTGHTFNTVEGGGKFKRSYGSGTASSLTGNWEGFLDNPTAIFEYYRTGASFTLPTNFTNYPNLVLSGTNATNQVLTFPAGVNVSVNGYLEINKVIGSLSTSTSSSDITITGNMNIKNNGSLRYNTVARNVYVGGNINVTNITGNPIAIFVNGTSTNPHGLYVGGDINLGASKMTLYSASNVVNLTFNGTGNSTFYSSSATSALNRVIVDKSNSNAIVDLLEDFTLGATAAGNSDTKPLYLVNGQCIVENNTLVLSSGGQPFNIPSTTSLTLKNTTASLSGNTGIWLDGKLAIGSGGVANFNGGTNNYIEYTASGNSQIDIDGNGTLKVGSQIRRSLNTSAGVLKFYQKNSGTTVEVGTVDAPSTTRGVFEILNTGSVFSQVANAQMTIKRSQTGSTFPDLYLDPATISLGTGSAITIEGGTSSDSFEVYTSKTLQNINVNGTAAVKLKTLPMTLNGSLTIASGAIFDANSLDLTINGNMSNGGTFTPNGNTTYFAGASAQTITGNVNFYNFSKTSSNTLSLAATSAIVVNGLFKIQSGTFNDGGNSVSLRGNVYNVGTTVSSSSEGLILNGTSEQTFDGSGTYGRLTINNLNGVRNATDGLTLTVSQELRMRKGVFAIGRNLLAIQKNATITEVSPFSETNMVSTNTSFTDAGILRYFPSGSRTLVYPIGADNKYTPVTFTITNNSSEAGYIRVKAANEPHLTILPLNKSNVLQYNWTFDAGNLSDFSATATLKCYAADIKPNSAAGANYITARLQNDGSGIWYKYSKDDFNELTNELSFYFSDVSNGAITGDYTAGLDTAIPSTVPKYRSVNSGDWTVGANWINETDNQPAPDGGPSGCIVKVNHAMNMNANFIAAYTTDISSTGTLIVNSATYGHRLGTITGTGKMKFYNGDMPAADYTQFVAAGTGTFEFAGNTDYSVLSSFASVNNLEFTGSNKRLLPNLSFTVLGNVVINGAELVNEYSKSLYFKGNATLTSGKFDPKTGTVTLNGATRQTVGGFNTSNADFYNLVINNSNGVQLSSQIDVGQTLTLTNGIVYTNSSAKLYVSRPVTGAVSGTSSASYIDGPFIRSTSVAAYTFNVGSNGRQAVATVSPITGSIGDWEVQYKNEATSLTAMISPVQYVSNNEYWSIQAPAINKTASITVRSDASSGVNPLNTDDLLVFYRETPLGWTDLGATLSGNINSGSATKASIVFDSFSGLGRITFGSKTNDVFDWTGTTSIDWFDGTNWSKGVVPSAASPVVINNTANKPVINNSSSVAYAKTLEIKSSSTLTLKPASKLSVYGNITNNGQLILEHNTESSSSFIYNGTGSVPNVKVSQTFNGESLRKWYVGHVITESSYADYTANVSAPVSSNFAMAYYITPGWSNVTGGNVGVPMKGYGVQFRSVPALVEHTGSLFDNTDRNTTLVKAGYHLVANPYPSYLDLTSYATQWDFSALDKSVWVFTGYGADRKFAAYNLTTGISTPVGVMTNYVAPLQGFFVSAPSANATFVIKKGAKSHGAGGSLKAGSVASNDILRISLVNSTSSDETVVVFRGIGSATYSGQLDTKKFTDANASIPFVYSLKNNEQVAINLMPEDPTPYIVPLGMSVGNTGAGSITLKAKNIGEFLPDVDVLLFDKVTGDTINLREKSEYTFTSAAVTNQNRFELSFKAIEKSSEVTTGIGNNAAGSDVAITAIGIGQKAIVKVKDAAFKGNVAIEVLDGTGKLFQGVVSNTERTEVAVPSNTQFYIVKVTYNGVVKSFKIMNVNRN